MAPGAIAYRPLARHELGRVGEIDRTERIDRSPTGRNTAGDVVGRLRAPRHGLPTETASIPSPGSDGRSRSTWTRARPASVPSTAPGWWASESCASTCGTALRSSRICTSSTVIEAMGSGKRVRPSIERHARTAGDTAMVVSATPSENAVRRRPRRRPPRGAWPKPVGSRGPRHRLELRQRRGAGALGARPLRSPSAGTSAGTSRRRRTSQSPISADCGACATCSTTAPSSRSSSTRRTSRATLSGRCRGRRRSGSPSSRGCGRARDPRVARGLVDDADDGRRPDRPDRRGAAGLDRDAPERRDRRGGRPLVLPSDRPGAEPRRLRARELPVRALPVPGAAGPRGRRLRGRRRDRRAIDERTLLVPISHVLFKGAEIQDVEPIVRRAHEVGAHVILDCYQSAGIVPLDVDGARRRLRGRRLGEVAVRRAGQRLAVRPARPRRAARADLHRLAGARAPFAFEEEMRVRARRCALPDGDAERAGALRRDGGLRPDRGDRRRPDP